MFGPAISRNAGYCITVFSGLVSEGSSMQAHRGRAAQSGVVVSIQEITASGEIGGARVGKPRHSRIPRMASREWMAAMILMRPRQRWHSRTSTSHARFMSSYSCVDGNDGAGTSRHERIVCRRCIRHEQRDPRRQVLLLLPAERSTTANRLPGPGFRTSRESVMVAVFYHETTGFAPCRSSEVPLLAG